MPPRKKSTPVDRPKKKVTHLPKRPLRYTKEQVKEALLKHGGFIYYTADQLDVAAETMRGYLKRWPELRQTIKVAKKKALDKAEHFLMELIEEKDFRAIKYFLSCKGKKRGYRPHKEVSVNAKPSAPVVNIEVPLSVSQSKMREILNKARENAGLAPMPGSMPLEIGLKELPDKGVVLDNKGVVLENTDGSSEHGTDQNPQS